MGNAPESADVLLSAHAVAAGHGDVQVCAPVTLRVPAGRAVALVGPNGAGKSTVLQTLVGLLPALDGEVRFGNGPVDERQAAFRRAVAQVLDDEAFFPSLTAREHLLLTARGHGVVEPEETVISELDAFGLTDRADALPSALSSGQRRRLALAAAFVRPVRLLVLDEPERRLDVDMRRALAARLVRDRDRGLAVLLASHDAELVRTVADDILLIAENECRWLDPAAATDIVTGHLPP
jgi:ABC-2 type transport system ATP-binding protein